MVIGLKVVASRYSDSRTIKLKVSDKPTQFDAVEHEALITQFHFREKNIQNWAALIPISVRSKMSRRESSFYDHRIRQLVDKYLKLIDLFPKPPDRENDLTRRAILDRNIETLVYSQASLGLGVRCSYFELVPLVAELVCSGRVLLQDIPPEYITSRLAKALVKRDGLLLAGLPLAQRSETVCYLAVTETPWAIQFVPKERQNASLFVTALSGNGLVLSKIPEPLRTIDLCLIAVSTSGLALAHVPMIFQTEELFFIAVKQNGLALGAVPEPDRSPELCSLAVQSTGLALQYVLDKTFDICLDAVSQNGLALEFVPPVAQTYSLCLKAVSQNGFALQYVRDDVVDLNLCKAAVRQSPCAVKYVSDRFITEASEPSRSGVRTEPNGARSGCVVS